MIVRAYQDGDGGALAAAYSAVYPQSPRSPQQFRRWMKEILAENGRCWVIVPPQRQQPVGYALVSPIPGLDGVYDLGGLIAPEWQRRGLGSRLLGHVLRAVRSSSVQQLSHCVTDLETPAAQFLRLHGFTVEHEEWEMARESSADLPPRPHLPEKYVALAAARTRGQAARLFCRLYRASFGETPWYQPYTLAEVKESLASRAHLLFLWQAREPIGFAWLHYPEAGVAALEPVGIVRERQGQGYGRYLLWATLAHLQRKGIGVARLGVWQQNEAAIQLYQGMGFRRRRTWTYLARETE